MVQCIVQKTKQHTVQLKEKCKIGCKVFEANRERSSEMQRQLSSLGSSAPYEYTDAGEGVTRVIGHGI